MFQYSCPLLFCSPLSSLFAPVLPICFSPSTIHRLPHVRGPFPTPSYPIPVILLPSVSAFPIRFVCGFYTYNNVPGPPSMVLCIRPKSWNPVLPRQDGTYSSYNYVCLSIPCRCPLPTRVSDHHAPRASIIPQYNTSHHRVRRLVVRHLIHTYITYIASPTY